MAIDAYLNFPAQKKPAPGKSAETDSLQPDAAEPASENGHSPAAATTKAASIETGNSRK